MSCAVTRAFKNCSSKTRRNQQRRGEACVPGHGNGVPWLQLPDPHTNFRAYPNYLATGLAGVGEAAWVGVTNGMNAP